MSPAKHERIAHVFIIIIHKRSCMRKMAGIPTTKYQCFVLWRKVYMPAIEPMLPPKSANKNKVFSGMRQRCFLAFCLSIPMEANPQILMSKR